jgi:hypothetical protein
MTNSTTFPGTVTASGFTGTSTNATNAVLATDATNASRPVIFGTATTGNVPLKTDPGLVYNPSSNKLTAGAFVGDGSELTGISAGFDADVDIIKIGNGAGTTTQGASAIAIGHDAGSSGTQGEGSVAVGHGAGKATQGDYAIAIGFDAAKATQGNNGIGIGYEAGGTSQGTNTVAVGTLAGQTSQGVDAVAIGRLAGQTSQGSNAIAIGYDAGKTSQASYSVAIGFYAGRNNMGGNNVAIGREACYQASTSCVGIGLKAGSTSGPQCVNVGANTGSVSAGQPLRVAVGINAGYQSHGQGCVAIGANTQVYSSAGYNLAFGSQAGYQQQPHGSWYVTPQSIRSGTGSNYMRFNTSTGEVSWLSSDDRVKDDETLITGAVKTLSKLRPQNYLKRTKLDPNDPDQNWTLEAGLMAQEVYYSVPEMRHLVSVPPEAGDIDTFTPPPSDDPSQDPDYSIWGDGIAGVDYLQMVPFLIKGVQEIVAELPRSKTTVSNTWGQNISGLVVSANTNKHKTNTVPIVNLSTVSIDKSWYGVVSTEKTDSIDYDTLVDIKGDSRIWVTDMGGALESGDLLTTSNVAPGYTQKQEGGALMNYTVAKVTQDCDFTEPLQISIKIPKRELSNVTYYIHDESYYVPCKEYEIRPSFKTETSKVPIYTRPDDDGIGGTTRYYQGDTEISFEKYQTLPDDDNKSEHTRDEISVEAYNEIEDDAKKATYSLGSRNQWKVIEFSKSKKKIPCHDEERIIEELVDVLDENGQIVWEETSNTVPTYTLVDHGTYKAALVSCKLI